MGCLDRAHKTTRYSPTCNSRTTAECTGQIKWLTNLLTMHPSSAPVLCSLATTVLETNPHLVLKLYQCLFDAP